MDGGTGVVVFGPYPIIRCSYKLNDNGSILQDEVPAIKKAVDMVREHYNGSLCVLLPLSLSISFSRRNVDATLSSCARRFKTHRIIWDGNVTRYLIPSGCQILQKFSNRRNWQKMTLATQL